MTDPLPSESTLADALSAEEASGRIVEVALNLPLLKQFDYRWPGGWPEPHPGLHVLVPFGNRKLGAVVTEVKVHSTLANLRDVEQVLGEDPVFPEEILSFTRWVAEYYLCSWGEALAAAIPGGLGVTGESLHKRGAKPKYERWVIRSKENTAPPPVTGRRRTKKDRIRELLELHPEISWKEVQIRINAPAEALRALEAEGQVRIEERRVFRRFLAGGLPEPEPFLTLNAEQQQAFEQVREALQEQAYAAFLLEGVTGSGKTEVYLHAVREAQARGKTSLVLVPEIALTPQLVNRFRARFGDEVAVLHSGMDDGERFDEWSRLRGGAASIVVGARSAVFAPLERLGLVIVDEEHDSSYKQGEAPRYHGRDVAVYRAWKGGAVVILGSATPSLESVENVQSGKYRALQLQGRVHSATLPEVRILDLRGAKRQGGSAFFTRELVEAMRTRLLRGEQGIIFLNRRGYAPLLLCEVCKESLTCPNCSLSLVLHQAARQVRCHQCDHTASVPSRCGHCGSVDSLKLVGVGTEQVEAELQKIFPQARVLRMDRDALHGKHALSKMQEAVRAGEVDLLVGTQLVTKGHDFPNVTLVGVLLADLGLNLPDFRASERTFQLLTQVAGRAGRAEKPGEVLVQTYNPQHHSLIHAQEHDTLGFRKRELPQRQLLRLPPYFHLGLVVCSSPEELRAAELATACAQLLQPFSNALVILGPLEAPLKKLRNRFRWQVLIKAEETARLRQALRHIQQHAPRIQRNELLQIDMDPQDLL